MNFKFLEHTADIKFQAYGKTLNELFENCALAVSSYLSRGEAVKSKKGKIIEVSGSDHESLLYNFLDELIYLLDADRFLLSKITVTLRGFNLKAELYGDDAENYNIDQIKAATYAEMYIKKTPKGWEAQAVLDV
jgi:SHS2 domain-containing protein